MALQRTGRSGIRMAAAMLVGALVASSVATSTQEAHAAPASSGSGKEREQVIVFIGTMTGGKSQSKGIYASRLDLVSGALSSPELAAEAERPGFIAVHPTGRFLYAARETGDGAGAAAFRIVDPKSGKLSPLNHEVAGGRGSCFISLDRDGRNALVANYGSGSVAVLPIDERGHLKPMTDVEQHEGKSVNPNRQEGPHAHSILVDPSNRFALACDLGIDKVMIYRFDAARGSLEANDPPFGALAPGAGPRHLAFSRDGRFAYVVNEMGNSVTAFAWDPQRGAMSEIHTISTLRDGSGDGGGKWTSAEILIHPNGRFLYASNRGPDDVALFDVDPTTGRLDRRGNFETLGQWPRNFGIDPSGRYLLVANQNSHDVVVFRIDQETGALSPTGSKIEVPSPTCVRFLEARDEP